MDFFFAFLYTHTHTYKWLKLDLNECLSASVEQIVRVHRRYVNFLNILLLLVAQILNVIFAMKKSVRTGLNHNLHELNVMYFWGYGNFFSFVQMKATKWID